jgi:hypothetical protein
MDTFNTFNGFDVLTIAAWFVIGDKAWLIVRYGKAPAASRPRYRRRQTGRRGMVENT